MKHTYASNFTALITVDSSTVVNYDVTKDLTCRGSERGTARPEVLQQLLATTERVVQQVDSVEYGLTDIQASVQIRCLFHVCFFLCQTLQMHKT